MRTVSVSLDLADILRERIDECAVFKRGTAENDADDALLWSKCLKLFLDRKEQLVIPDDALLRIVAGQVRDSDPRDLTFAYQDFYAYQFIDKLNDVVRRAHTVRDVFAKNPPSETTRRLCSEAFQCFLYGHHTASVALLRSVIETTLKEHLGIEVGDLSKLNDEGLRKRLYVKRIWYRIDDIRRQCNKFVHEAVRGRTPGERENLKLLGLAQEVLQALSEAVA